MKNFVNKVISLIGMFLGKWLSGSTDEVSSRRATAFVALTLLVLMVVSHSFYLVEINTEIYVTTAALTATALGLTLYNGRKNF